MIRTEGSGIVERDAMVARFPFRSPVPGPRSPEGFTLVELAVVIVVLSLVAMIVIPLLPSSNAATMGSSARSVAALVRYLGDQAVTTKAPFRMALNLTDNTITVKKIVNGEETVPEDPFFARKVLPEGIAIEDVITPRLGKVGEGTVNVDFGMEGLGDLLIIHLKGGDERRMTVTALPAGGRVDILEGYQTEMNR